MTNMTIYLFRPAREPLLVRIVRDRTFFARPGTRGWTEVDGLDVSMSNDLVILPAARAIELMDEWGIEPDDPTDSGSGIKRANPSEG